MCVRRLAAGTAALLMPFAACSDGDSNADPVDPTSSATSASPTPSESRSPDPVAPTLPAAARAASQPGAKAFVSFYFALVTHALSTGETQPLAEHASSNCASCRATERNIEKVYARGESWRNYAWSATQFTEIPDQSPETISLLFTLHESRGQRIGVDGQVSKQITPRRRPMHARLIRESSGWRIDSLELIRE